MTSTLVRLADAATNARGGADLFRFGLDSRIPDSAFAKEGNNVRISGVDLLKAGVFNGLSLVDEDLVAMVVRFGMLYDSGVFVPPVRLDHSWSVLSVIGYHENLETYRRTDETDGAERTFLRGDYVLTGSVDYTPAQIVDAIKRGALRSRSSELGYYVTNAGQELPLVFSGSAFVDIPAVEGLAPVTLSKRPEPHSIVNLTEGSATMDPAKIARLRALRAMTSLSAEDETERDALEAEATETGTEIPDEDPAATETASTGEAVTTDAGEAGDNVEAGEIGQQEDPSRSDPAAVDEAHGTDSADGSLPAGQATAERAPETPAQTPEVTDELAAARAEISRLRSEAADRRIAEFRRTGVLNRENEEAARTLLAHESEEVRRLSGTLLASIPARVETDTRRGSTALSSEGPGSEEVIRPGMPASEVGPLWASLTKDERTARAGEMAAWRQYREENGIRGED